MGMTVLTSTQTTGATFYAPGGWSAILLSGHAGGTWKLQARVQGTTTWVDTDVSFAGSGLKAFMTSFQLEYRMTGGSAGATATLVDLTYPGVPA